MRGCGRALTGCALDRTPPAVAPPICNRCSSAGRWLGPLHRLTRGRRGAAQAQVQPRVRAARAPAQGHGPGRAAAAGAAPAGPACSILDARRAAAVQPRMAASARRACRQQQHSLSRPLPAPPRAARSSAAAAMLMRPACDRCRVYLLQSQARARAACAPRRWRRWPRRVGSCASAWPT